MAFTSWNDILNKPKGVDDIEEIALAVEDLSASVLSISEDVGELALDVSQLSASVLSIAGEVEEIDNTVNNIEKEYYLTGNMYALALNNGKIQIGIQRNGTNDFNTGTASKLTNISGSIYGDIGATSTSLTIDTISVTPGYLYVTLGPDVTLSNYASTARGFMIQIAELIKITLSKTP